MNNGSLPRIGFVVSPQIAESASGRSAQEHTAYNLARMLGDQFDIELIGTNSGSDRLNKVASTRNPLSIGNGPNSTANAFLWPLRVLSLFIYVILHRPAALINIGGIGTNGLAVAIVGKVLRIPTVVRVTGPTFTIHQIQDGKWESTKTYIRNTVGARFSLVLATRILSVGEGAKRSLVEHGIHESKIIVIPNALDLSGFTPNVSKLTMRERLGISTDKQIVAFVGGLARDKGFDRFVEIIKKIDSKSDQVCFVVVGGDITRNKSHEKSLKQFSTDLVKYVGNVPHQQVAQYLQAADVSLYVGLQGGGYSISGLESLAAGTPVIAQNAGSDVSATYRNLCDTTDEFVSMILDKKYENQQLPDMFEWNHIRERHIEFFRELIGI
jgi:glycosyltransferase involved in cell wall biosynthesis